MSKIEENFSFFAKTNGFYIWCIFFVEYVYACTIINQDFHPPNFLSYVELIWAY